MTDQLTHPAGLRSDARDNRERILEVAREVFAAEGLDVPMREIARRAEVGPATLYRRFPTKESLVIESFSAQMAVCTRLVDEGVADSDPWRGFCRVIEGICEIHALDRGFTAAFLAAYPRAADLAGTRDHAVQALSGLARRAKESGDLRPDFVLDDFLLVIMANGGIRTTSPAAALAASRRFAALIIESFRARPDAHPLPPPTRLPLAVGH